MLITMQMYDRQGGEIKNVIPVDKGCIFYVMEINRLDKFSSAFFTSTSGYIVPLMSFLPHLFPF